jgi:hypothetical protein
MIGKPMRPAPITPTVIAEFGFAKAAALDADDFGVWLRRSFVFGLLNFRPLP